MNQDIRTPGISCENTLIDKKIYDYFRQFLRFFKAKIRQFFLN